MAKKKAETEPDRQGSAAWLSGQAVVQAAICWEECLASEDDVGIDRATAGLQKAVRTYLRVRKQGVVIRNPERGRTWSSGPGVQPNASA